MFSKFTASNLTVSKALNGHVSSGEIMKTAKMQELNKYTVYATCVKAHFMLSFAPLSPQHVAAFCKILTCLPLEFIPAFRQMILK